MILLAINDPDTQAMLYRELGDAGINVWNVNDGEDLCNVAQDLSGLVEVVVVDARLSSLCGAAVVAKLRAAGLNMPVVVVIPQSELTLLREAHHVISAGDRRTFFVGEPNRRGVGLQSITAIILGATTLPRNN
ncbi:MAG: response regulator [Phycisphaera sp.]|nr:response regulator [Phycisphaera sp.]